jgi:hypothetical protein
LNQWNEFVEDFVSLNITPLRPLSKKLGLSEQTVFNWRQKLISTIVLNEEPRFVDELTEFDEAHLRLSRKGRKGLGIKDMNKYRHWRKGLTGDSRYSVKVFFTYGRTSKQLELFQSHTGKTKKIDIRNYFIQDKFKDVTMICDKHKSYQAFFEENDIKYENFKSSHHVSFTNHEVHNQTLNAFIRGMKYFVNEHLRGVSTKYLPFYIKWYQFIHQSKTKAFKRDILKFNLTDNVCENVVYDRKGLELYRQAETGFVRFLNNNGRTNFGSCKHHYYANKMAA